MGVKLQPLCPWWPSTTTSSHFNSKQLLSARDFLFSVSFSGNSGDCGNVINMTVDGWRRVTSTATNGCVVTSPCWCAIWTLASRLHAWMHWASAIYRTARLVLLSAVDGLTWAQSNSARHNDRVYLYGFCITCSIVWLRPNQSRWLPNLHSKWFSEAALS